MREQQEASLIAAGIASAILLLTKSGFPVEDFFGFVIGFAWYLVVPAVAVVFAATLLMQPLDPIQPRWGSRLGMSLLFGLAAFVGTWGIARLYGLVLGVILPQPISITWWLMSPLQAGICVVYWALARRMTASEAVLGARFVMGGTFYGVISGLWLVYTFLFLSNEEPVQMPDHYEAFWTMAEICCLTHACRIFPGCRKSGRVDGHPMGSRRFTGQH